MNNKALASLLLGFILWGFFPLYFAYLQAIPSEQVLYARIILSAIFLTVFFIFKRQLHASIAYLFTKRVFIVATVSAFFISANWFIYIWAVQHQQTLQASLGYFITPFFNIIIAVLFFKERLGRWQITAIAFAAIGMFYQIFSIGELPWITVLLGLSFACYGGIRKKFPLRPMYGLYGEMIVLSPIALIILLWLYSSGEIFDFDGNVGLFLALMASGVITVLPLLLFLNAVVALPMTTVAFAQFLTPTLQFLIAVFVFNEPFDVHKLITFILIWTGVGLYSVHLYQINQRVNQ